MNNSNKAEVPVQFRRVYRAFVQAAPDSRSAELTVFVEATSRDAAIRKICQAIALLEFGTVAESVIDRIYNLSSADELMNDGLSETLEERLLETGWSGGKPTHFVRHPLVLMRDPAPLLTIWARLGSGREES
jgi:hypothetical protein